jgi:ubiquinone/menaquinone biosynthesis C-methylase UbiE
MKNELSGTHQTYQIIAKDYAKNWEDRSILATHVARFVTLVTPGGLVLDVGCGPGFDTAVFQTHNLRTIGLDYSMEMMQTGRQQYQIRTPMVRADMRHLPVAASIADGLWVSASMLHLHRTDVPATLDKFYRVLKPGGVLYLSVKLGEGEAWVDNAYGHDASRFFTFWQPKHLDTLLSTARFTNIDGWTDRTTDTHWVVRFVRK